MKKNSINELTPSCIRKRGQRVRQNLSENPVAWDTTLSHILKNATPRRKSMLMGKPGITDLENFDETLNNNKVGRPCREVINVKKQLAFIAQSEDMWKNDFQNPMLT